MGYLKNKTFGFYLSFVAAILALIGFVMYRQSGHTESYACNSGSADSCADRFEDGT